MKTYTFHEGPLPPHILPDFDAAFFNLPEFRFMQQATGWLSFFVVDERSGKAAAWIHFYLDNDIARSPYKAPFGSLDCNERIYPQVLFDFIMFAESRLKSLGVRQVVIKNPPRAYAPEFLSLLETFLLNCNYKIADAEIGTTLAVDDSPFTNHIRHSEMSRNRQAQTAGFTVHELAIGEVDQVYCFIADCHKEKGYTMSITGTELRTSVQRFPGRYILFGVFEGKHMIGASVSIRVKENILYNFLINHPLRYNHLSPPVPLIEGLYEHCRRNGIVLLDLGTSSLHGKPNFSLLDFKMHLGGMPTTKYSFHKSLL